MTLPPKTKVSVAHHKEPEPSDEDVVRRVEQALEPLGGMGFFVPSGATVLIKPNQTIFFHAKDGVTTDPRVVAALVLLAKQAGAGEVVVGDGAGGDLRSERVLEITGVKRLALKAGADRVVAFEALEHIDVPVDVDGETYAVPIPRLVQESDVVINVPKAKTHFEDPITCCLKNWVGVIEQSARPRFMDDPLLYKVIAELHRHAPAHLNVVDGLWAGVGSGPAANDAEWLGCIVAGDDPVAVDHVVGRLMGLEERRFRFQEEAEEVGLGTRDPGRIEVIGAKIEDVRIKARPTPVGMDHLSPRVLIGEGVAWAGSLGHLKSLSEVFEKYGLWKQVESVYGRPTFMVGRVHDPDFEAHVEEGPYFVIDDVAHEQYKMDERTTFIPGHPATHNMFAHIFKRLHVEHVGPGGMELAKALKRAEGYFHFRTWNAAPQRQ